MIKKIKTCKFGSDKETLESRKPSSSSFEYGFADFEARGKNPVMYSEDYKDLLWSNRPAYGVV